jgi:NADP-reducing hydrogenase subunit HndB
MAELDEIRERTLQELSVRSSEQDIKVVVGMATCGIAAGARDVVRAFMEEKSRRNLKNFTVSITGCIDVCNLEPIVEVIDKNNNKVTYVKMTAEKVTRVVDEHIVKGNVCHDLTIGAEQK